MSETTIRNCCSKTGFNSTPSTNNYEKEDELPLSELKEKWEKRREYGTICEDGKHEDYESTVTYVSLRIQRMLIF